jgi:glycosyltransferase involved in cell wall biosynthesis
MLCDRPNRSMPYQPSVCLAAWAPFVAGAEIAATRLALGLQEQGVRVLMVLGTRGEALQQMERAGLRCVYVPLGLTDKRRFWRYFVARRALGRLLQREKPDIVHANDLPTSQMVSAAAARLGIPRICHHRFPFSRPAIDWLNKFGAERHLFVSRALMEQMVEESPALRQSSRAVVYDGLPLPAVPTAADRQRARHELGLLSDKVVVLFAGQIIEIKGIAELIRAWSLMPGEVRNAAELLVVGEDLAGGGTYRRRMEALAAELRVPARFVGFQADVPRWLTAADMAVVPSHVEPLGLVSLEAMSHALPVIGAAVGGICEVIVHQQTGLLVPPKDPAALASAMETLITNPALRQELGCAGRRRCEEHFSLQSHVQNVLREYDQVLSLKTR